MRSLALVASLALSAGTAHGQNTFPVTSEFSVVFPQNDTYAVVSPFPVILGFHRNPALLYFSTALNWELSCGGDALQGYGHITGDEEGMPDEFPYYQVKMVQSLADETNGTDGSFPYWRGKTEHCSLSWDFQIVTQCEREKDGSLLIQSGYYKKQYGSVNFTLALDGKEPLDAISDYKGCAESGLAVRIKANESTCAVIEGDGIVDTKPCDLAVKAAESSLAAQVAKPTTTLTKDPSATSDSAPKQGSSSPKTTDSSSSSDNDGSTQTEDSDSGKSSGAVLVVDNNALVVMTSALIGSLALTLLL